VAAPGHELEALVRDELRAPVQELVRRLVPELVAEALNGSVAASARTSTPPATPQTKICRTCGQEKPIGAYDRHRGTCRQCRQRQARDREQRTSAAPTSDDVPRPGGTAQAE
jgi:ribosomal protein L40E